MPVDDKRQMPACPNRTTHVAVAAAAVAAVIASALVEVHAAEPGPRLSLPVACTLGETCFIQHFVDLDPGPAATDFRCTHASYEGHKGTDFRLLSAAAALADDVPVRAAAAGIVKGTRDGMADSLVEAGDKATVADRECGNGVVIDHGDGWETQYCHMKRGSLAVKRGQRVATGATLGHVGFSGLAGMAHLHLSVRHNGQVVDPFTGRTPAEGCSATAATTASSLWTADAGAVLAHHDGLIFQSGFAAGTVGVGDLERDHRIAPPVATSPALVLFARIAHVRAGDRIRLEIDGPAGRFAATETDPLARTQPIYLAYAGRKRRAEPWPAGLYRGRTALVRDGKVISERQATLRISP